MALPLLVLLLLAAFAIIGVVHAYRLYRPAGVPRTRNTNRRMLPVLRQTYERAARECGQCQHFEPTGFEEVRRRAPAAAEAARWLNPSQMQTVETKTKPEDWTEEKGFDAQEGQPVAMGGPRWDEIGVCHKKEGTLTFQRNPDCGSWL